MAVEGEILRFLVGDGEEEEEEEDGWWLGFVVSVVVAAPVDPSASCAAAAVETPSTTVSPAFSRLGKTTQSLLSPLSPTTSMLHPSTTFVGTSFKLCTMQSISPLSSSTSISSVHSDFPACASVCRSVVLSLSPATEMGIVCVGRDGWRAERREVKMVTWARARAEARVPMRRVRGGAVMLVVVVEVEKGAGGFSGVWSGGCRTSGGGVEVMAGGD